MRSSEIPDPFRPAESRHPCDRSFLSLSLCDLSVSSTGCHHASRVHHVSARAREPPRITRLLLISLLPEDERGGISSTATRAFSISAMRYRGYLHAFGFHERESEE